MVKVYLGLILAVLIFQSCSSNVKNKEAEIEKKFEYPEVLTPFLDKFSSLKLEFNLNQKFIGDSIKNHKNHILSMDEVKLLAENLAKDEHTESNSYYLRDYYKIESAKSEKKYEEYLSKLDIGMMKNATCYALGKFEYGDSLALLVWKIEFDSYEACPYYYGSHFLGTIIADGKIVQTIQLAAQEHAADAPMVSETKHDSKITKDGKIFMNSESIVNEEEMEVEHYEDKFEFRLTKKGFIKK